MIVVSITEPRFIREVIDRRRSVIVAYGRMESTAPQELCVLFQGQILHRQVGHNGKLDARELVKKHAENRHRAAKDESVASFTTHR